MCHKHWRRWRKHGDPKRVYSNHPAAVPVDRMCATGINIHARRIQRDMSIAELVKQSGVSRATLWRICQGDDEGRLSTLRSLAAALKCQDWELIRPETFGFVR